MWDVKVSHTDISGARRGEFSDLIYQIRILELRDRCYMQDNQNYNGISEIDRYCRSQILIIQGIISFFTGFPLTVYNCYESSSEIGLNQYCVQGTHLIINDVDFTSDLIKMIERIKEEPQLTITLLDRWRKALYLKSESYYADLYCDESTLNFFHIFELFGECYAKELKNTLENNIENMLEKHF